MIPSQEVYEMIPSQEVYVFTEGHSMFITKCNSIYFVEGWQNVLITTN